MAKPNSILIFDANMRGGREKSAHFLRCIFLIVAVSFLLANSFAAADETESSTSPRQYYNDGANKLAQGKLQEAEANLQAAVASQNERIQPFALYNLGETRFLQGEAQLKQGPGHAGAMAGSQNASAAGNSALQTLDQALAGEDLDNLVAAYLRGRGARRELKSARDAVKQALDSYAVVLAKWQRASDDFKSANEMQPSAAAQTNAAIMDRKIAKLIDLQQMMMQAMQGMGKQRSDLKQKMDAAKNKLPQELGEKMKGSNGEEDDDEEGDEQKPPEPKPGMEDAKPNGKEMSLSPDEAMRLLGMLKLDTGRKLPMGGSDEPAKTKKFSGRDW
jgi:hypothetical protein